MGATGSDWCQLSTSVIVLTSAEAFYRARHVAVFAPSLWAEWQKHVRRGSSGRRWLIRMAERRLIDQVAELDSAWIEVIICEHLLAGDA